MSVRSKYGQEKRISLVVPTLNEASNISYVFSNIPELVDEIVVVDGDSTDGTREKILKHRKDAKIIIEKTKGKGSAIKKGFNHATGDIIVMMDADGSHNPMEIPQLIEPLVNYSTLTHGASCFIEKTSPSITALAVTGSRFSPQALRAVPAPLRVFYRLKYNLYEDCL